ncbi:MAG: hypothetical protein ACXWJK_15595 [Burkholderiaceae bacterium]
MSMKRCAASAAVAAALMSAAGTAAAAEFQVASLSALYKNDAKADSVLGTGTEGEHLATCQFEYFGTFKYGGVDVDAEVFHGKDIGGAGAGSYGGTAVSAADGLQSAPESWQNGWP